ncbi:hypothetical protein FGRMN_9904 [Fusarium graminum]|nr:hypothetical protein FGRMN_9904 [Fusarium graminum]
MQWLIAQPYRLSPTPSTGKLRRRRRDGIAANPETNKDLLCRSLFSTNYLMLATVFSAGFAWEIGFNNVMDKVWDNNNRGRQWKDIRHKFLEGGDEDEE